MITLTALCRELKNYFTADEDKHLGDFVVEDGKIELSDLVDRGSLHSGQYFRIVGSVFNDGVYQYPAEGLTDETFSGSIWSMKGDGLREALALLDDINAWEAKYHGEGSNIDSPYSSESFGGYSYTKAAGGNSSASGASADAGTWQNQFRSRLNSLRKIRV